MTLSQKEHDRAGKHSKNGGKGIGKTSVCALDILECFSLRRHIMTKDMTAFSLNTAVCKLTTDMKAFLLKLVDKKLVSHNFVDIFHDSVSV